MRDFNVIYYLCYSCNWEHGGVTRSNFSDNCIYALRRASRCRHSQAQAFYSKQKHPLHPLKSLF